MEVGTLRVREHLSSLGVHDVLWIGGSRDRTDVVRVGNAVCKVFLFDGDEPDREIAALTLLDGSEFPAPSIVDAGVFPEGERWVLMTEVAGDPVPLASDAWETPLGHRFQHLRGRVAGLLHSVACPPAFGLWTIDPHSSLADLAADTSHQLAVHAMETRSQRVPLIKALRHLQSDLLESLRPVRDPVLVHGDLGPGNILVDLSAEPMAMTALVDWEKAGASDPAAEFSSVFLFGFDSEGVRAFCRGYWEKEPMHEVVRERVAYFLIDAIFEAFATTGRRWSPRLDAQAQKAASSLLGGILPDPLGRG